jgi:branched-chain amino acid transport system substrate-binding protein
MKATRKWQPQAALFGLALVIAACGPAPGSDGLPTPVDGTSDESIGPAGATGEPIKIGIHVPLTGPAAFDGEAHLNGMLLAVKERNEVGGILGGRPVEAIYYDDKGVPEEGVSVVKRLITADEVVAITGSFLSSVTLAVKEVTVENQILHVVSNATAPAITEEFYKYLFRTNSTNAQKADFYAEWIVDKLQPESVYMLAVNNDYGRAEMEAYQTRWEALEGGPDIMAIEYFPDTETDFSVYLNKVRAAAPDYVYWATPASSQNAVFVQQAKALGFGTEGQPGLLAPGGNLTFAFLELAGQAAEDLYTMDNYFITLPTDKNLAFVEAYTAEYPDADPPSKYEPMGYNAMNILLDAMDEAGSETDYDAIMETVKSTTWDTLYGEITFDQNGQINMPAYGLQIVDGQFEPVD